ncbi:MAG: leucine-rich repeat domain-containing protein [Candidatus Babeliales bacterium]|jgi:Leucine-rich repeat (LRR) protein
MRYVSESAFCGSIKILSLFIFLWTYIFAENDIQTLIDSGNIKNCFLSGGTLQLAGKGLQNLNGIENVPNVESIKIIDLSHNQIKSLNGSLFKRFTNLAELLLNHNLIEQFTSLDGLNNLRELHLTHNKLKTFDLEQLSKLYMLYVLNLGFNEISVIKTGDNVISKNLDSKNLNSKNLEMLFLNNNKIKELPANAFVACPNLQALYLQNNVINNLDSKSFSRLFNIRLLYLYDNCITKLPANIFVDLKQLHLLYLRNNNIQIFEKGCDVGLDELKILDL